MTQILSNLVELEHLGWPGQELKAHFLYKIPDSLLQTLTVKNQSFHWDTLSNLTKLISLVVRNGYVTGGSLIDVFEANPMLEEVVLHLAFQNPGPATSLPLTLSRLTHLELVGLSAHDFHDITIPSLHILRMTRVAGANMLLRALHRGPVVLTELTIRSTMITSSQLVPFLRAASSLETFELSHIDGQVNAVVETLATQPSPSPSSSSLETPICHRLTHVTLSACPNLKTGAVIRLVKSRLPAVQPESHPDAAAGVQCVTAVAQIETLVVDKCPLIEPEVLPWLRSRVRTFSCVYATGKDARWRR
jgi:hypothetical protein